VGLGCVLLVVACFIFGAGVTNVLAPRHGVKPLIRRILLVVGVLAWRTSLVVFLPESLVGGNGGGGGIIGKVLSPPPSLLGLATVGESVRVSAPRRCSVSIASPAHRGLFAHRRAWSGGSSGIERKMGLRPRVEPLGLAPSTTSSAATT